MYHALSKQDLSLKVPALFTVEGHHKTSERYQPISTAMIVDGLAEEGFFPTHAIQANVRSDEKTAYAKHMIRFRHHQDLSTPGNVAPEIVLVNSHDGLSSYRLYAGVIRFACLNGLIVGNRYDEIRIRHQGDILSHVIEGTYQIAQNFGESVDLIQQMSQMSLSQEQQLYLAQKAHDLRFGDDDSQIFESSRLLRPRRFSDKGCDLFSTFNVIQENIIRGGVAGYRINQRGFYKRTTSRAIKSIDQNLKMNQNLWSEAKSLMLHAA